MRSISATLPTLTELFTVAAHTELTARVAAVVSCDEALALKDRAASDIAPHLQAVSHICNCAFPNGRLSTDAAAYAADDLPEQVEHVASSGFLGVAGLSRTNVLSGHAAYPPLEGTPQRG